MMESAKALAATAAIRQMVQALLAGVQPKSTARQDALAELNIIPPHTRILPRKDPFPFGMA
jgi:hypothetical protein